MWWSKVLLTCVALVSLECAAQNHSEEFKEEYIWSSLDFMWPDDSSKAEALKKGHFQPENNVLSGIKVWQGRIYLTIPRWKPGVPATLVSIPASNTVKRSINLEPFPDWNMQVVGDCNALQFVQNIEIDPNGQLWALDSGRTNILTSNPDNRCPPKLIHFDLQRRRMVKTFKFPDTVMSKENDSILVDLVIDSEDVIYISDASKSDPGIIVFDTNNEQAWKVRDSSMMGDKMLNALNDTAGDRLLSFLSNVNALALTPKPTGVNMKRTLYYSPLNSYNLYSISTSILREQVRATASNIHTSVTDFGNKTSLSQTMIIDSRNIMYLGLNSNHSIAWWDTKKLPLIDNLHVFTKDPVRMQWPSSFALDTEGNLWVISNKFQNLLTEDVNLQDVNFRIMRATTNTSSYLYSEEEEKTTPMPTTTTRMPQVPTNTDNTHHMEDHDHTHGPDHNHEHHGHEHHENHTHMDVHGKPNNSGNAADSVARPATTILAILASVMTFILTLQ